MASAVDSVDADWTVQNDRRIAQPSLMLINGVISGTALADLKARYPVQAPVQSLPSDKNNFAQGHCYCNKIRLELPLDIKPAISVICHCHDCREWHSVGSLPYMMFPLSTYEDETGTKFRLPIKVSPSGICSYSYGCQTFIEYHLQLTIVATFIS